MSKESLSHHLQIQQIGPQWKTFLHQLANQFNVRADANDLRELMKEVGASMAHDFSKKHKQLDTLRAVQDACNAYWSAMHWGCVDISEQARSIELTHYEAPLALAFGRESLPWSCACLEGFYQVLFLRLGAHPSSRVERVGEEADGWHIKFRLQA